MSEQDADLRWLKWEWLTARVVVAIGFGLPIVVLLLLLILPHFIPSGSTTASRSTRPAQSADAAGRQLCGAAVEIAQRFGVVPGFARSTSGPQKSDVSGRYVCSAITDVTKYNIAVDLTCQDLTDERCYNLFSVSQDDGSVLYQRQG